MNANDSVAMDVLALIVDKTSSARVNLPIREVSNSTGHCERSVWSRLHDLHEARLISLERSGPRGSFVVGVTDAVRAASAQYIDTSDLTVEVLHLWQVISGVEWFKHTINYGIDGFSEDDPPDGSIRWWCAIEGRMPESGGGEDFYCPNGVHGTPRQALEALRLDLLQIIERRIQEGGEL